MNMTFTEVARAGYDGNPNPHKSLSASFYAHALGTYLHHMGYDPPRNVRLCHDDRMWANGKQFSFRLNADLLVEFSPHRTQPHLDDDLKWGDS